MAPTGDTVVIAEIHNRLQVVLDNSMATIYLDVAAFTRDDESVTVYRQLFSTSGSNLGSNSRHP